MLTRHGISRVLTVLLRGFFYLCGILGGIAAVFTILDIDPLGFSKFGRILDRLLGFMGGISRGILVLVASILGILIIKYWQGILRRLHRAFLRLSTERQGLSKQDIQGLSKQDIQEGKIIQKVNTREISEGRLENLLVRNRHVLLTGHFRYHEDLCKSPHSIKKFCSRPLISKHSPIFCKEIPREIKENMSQVWDHIDYVIWVDKPANKQFGSGLARAFECRGLRFENGVIKGTKYGEIAEGSKIVIAEANLILDDELHRLASMLAEVIHAEILGLVILFSCNENASFGSVIPEKKITKIIDLNIGLRTCVTKTSEKCCELCKTRISSTYITYEDY